MNFLIQQSAIAAYSLKPRSIKRNAKLEVERSEKERRVHGIVKEFITQYLAKEFASRALRHQRGTVLGRNGE